MLELNLLGIPKISWQGKSLLLPSPKNLAILSYLALSNQQIPRKDLSELFWKDGKASNVRFVLHKLRNIQGSEVWLETSESFVWVNALTDVKRFELAMQNKHFAKALEIYPDGDLLLKGLSLNDADNFTSWLELERSRLTQLYLDALQGQIAELEHTHQIDEALKLASMLLKQDKLNENVHRCIMRLEHQRGNTEAALAQFESLRKILREELDVEPLEETLNLLRDIEGGSMSSKRALFLKPDIPFVTPELFGRKELIEDIEKQLSGKKRVLLHGFGGTGKTAMATLVTALWLKKKQSSVLWLQAGDDDPTTLFDAIAKALDSQQTQNNEFTKTIHNLLKHKISLVVLDDAWNAYALSKVLEVIPETIPVLITSRQRYPNLTRVDVGKLERQAALELLSHFAELPVSHAPEKMNDLCNLLSDHAFALRIAGITLSVDKLTPEMLLQRIADSPHTLKTPSEFAEAGRESVAALLSASLAALSEEAYEAFMGIGALFTTSCTSELLSLCTRRNQEETENALITLQRRGLAERISEAGSDIITYRLHDLAYSFAKANNHFRLSTAQRACQTFLEHYQHDFQVLDAEISNLLGAAEATKNNKHDALFVKMMRELTVSNAYYAARGHSLRSFELLKVACNKAKNLGDIEAAHFLIARMGDTYRELYGDLGKALESFEEALRLARALPNTEREAVMLGLIGITRFSQGAADSKHYLEQGYTLAKSKQFDEPLGRILQHLSYIACHEKDWQAARSYSLESISLATDSSKTEQRKNLFFSLLNLGESEAKLNRLKQALSARQQALKVALDDGNLLWKAYAFEGIAEIQHELGNTLLAQESFQQALELFYQNNALTDMEDCLELMKKAGYSVNPKQSDRMLQ